MNSRQQTYSYVYDRFGNRWQQNAPQGGGQFVASFTGNNNRMDGYSYDVTGNLTYDANGQGVEKNVNGVKTEYIYDATGMAVAEVNGSGVIARDELYAAGKHVGTCFGGTTYFNHTDWLGTERVRSDMTGAACGTIAGLPFGDGQTTGGSCGDPSTRHFTGKERDSESGLDYFGARYYSNGLGRFITPDWAAKAVDVPYAEFSDPQSLNLYGYVRNIPTVKIDVDGHCCSFSDVMDFVAGAVNAYSSDMSFGAGRLDGTSNASKLGAAVGDAAATVQGTSELLAGVGGEAGGLVLDATGAGALIGIPANVVSAGAIVHGGSTALNGIVHLAKNATGTATDSKPHGNTAGNQPAELYEKYDKNGKFEKHGVSQNAGKRYTKKQINGGTIKVTARGPRKQMLAKERGKVETNPGPMNKEPWAGKRKSGGR